MGSSKVFQWARAVLSPQFLSHVPSDIDIDVLLSEITDGLQLGLTTDLTTGISCLALQGKWEDLLEAECKLTELLMKWREVNDTNESRSLCVETNEKSSHDNIKLISSKKLVKFDENVAELPKDSVAEVYQSSEATFSQELPANSSDKTSSLQEDSIVSVISKEEQLDCNVEEVFVVSDDCTQLDLLPSLTHSISSDPQDTLNSSDEADKISMALDSSSQLIIVTNSADDLKTEDLIVQSDENGEELYMNIVLSSKKDYDTTLSDMDLKENMKIKNGNRENPLDKLCQLLKINEEESASEVTNKRHNEFERRRRYEEKMPFKHFCPHCSFKTKRQNQYVKHLKLHENNKIIYHCGRCPFKTIRSTTLRRHELEHSENRILNCVRCPYKSDSLELLKRHIQTKHSSTKSGYQCGQCDFKVDSLRILRRHKFEYHAVKPQTILSCNLCSYKTPNKGHLKRHKSDVHESVRSYLCHHCGKSYKRYDVLKQHKVTHGEIGTTYPCPQCDKICHSTAHLKEHMTVHSTLRPFLCELCGSTFKTLSIQKKHVRMVHNSTRFVTCANCKRIFSNKITLARHLRTHCSKYSGVDNTACNTSKSLSSGNSCPPNEENGRRTSGIKRSS